MNAHTIAIGPEIDRPTWSWVGFNLFRKLATQFPTRVFRPGDELTDSIVISIKEPLAEQQFRQSQKQARIYLPCDYYESRKLLDSDTRLAHYDSVGVHSLKHLALFEGKCKNLFFLEHDSKFVTPKIQDYKQDGFILWVGFSRYLPLLSAWIEQHPALPLPLIALTDKPGQVSCPPGVFQMRWSPRVQFELMQRAKAAIDIKGDDFNQLMKPPEKLQTFIASGIPSAINHSSPVADYFISTGFPVCDPENVTRWLSEEYYRETTYFASELRKRMCLKSVTGTLINEIKKLGIGL